MSQEITLVCDWCGDKTLDRERGMTWLIGWSLVSGFGATQREDLCPECRKTLETAIYTAKKERKKR